MKRKTKIILMLCSCILMTGVFGLAGIMLINQHVKQEPLKYMIAENEAADQGEMDCILVLGAGVRADGSPSLMLRDRLEKAIELYENGACGKILMSGDHGRKEYDEVNVMKEYAIEAGVPSEDIFMDHAGFSTYESIYRAKAIFEADRILVVTQQYHMHRALYIAEKLGVEAYGIPAEDIAYYGQTVRELREVAARVKDFFTVMIKPEPTYLGEEIPVSGDGNVTNDR